MCRKLQSFDRHLIYNAMRQRDNNYTHLKMIYLLITTATV